MSNFNSYWYCYKDREGNWGLATNPVFIAEHPYCKAIKKQEGFNMEKFLRKLNSFRIDSRVDKFAEKMGLI